MAEVALQANKVDRKIPRVGYDKTLSKLEVQTSKAKSPQVIDKNDLKILEKNIADLKSSYRKEAIVKGNLVFLPEVMGIVRAVNTEVWKKHNQEIFEAINKLITEFNEKASSTYVFSNRVKDLQKTISSLESKIDLLKKIQGVDSEIIGDCNKVVIKCLQTVYPTTAKVSEIQAIPIDRHLYRKEFPVADKVNEIISKYQSFDEYYQKVVKKHLAPGSPEINLPEALIIFAAFEAKRTNGQKNKFNGDLVMQQLQDLANNTAKILSAKFPEHQGMSREDLNRMPKEKIEAVIKCLGESILGDRFKFDQSFQSRTIDQVLKENTGVCEDFTNIYLCVVQLLKKAGYDFPIYPSTSPGHIRVIWDQGVKSSYMIETTEKGIITNNDLRIKIPGETKELQYTDLQDPRLYQHYDRKDFIPLPIHSALAGDIGNSTKNIQEDSEQEKRMIYLAEMIQSNSIYNVLSLNYLNKEKYILAIKAADKAINIDAEKPSAYDIKSRALFGLYIDDNSNHQAVKYLGQSLKNSKLSQNYARNNLENYYANDMLARIWTEIYWETGDLKFAEEARRNYTTLKNLQGSIILLEDQKKYENKEYRIDPLFIEIKNNRSILPATLSPINKSHFTSKLAINRNLGPIEVDLLLHQIEQDQFSEYRLNAVASVLYLADKLKKQTGTKDFDGAVTALSLSGEKNLVDRETYGILTEFRKKHPSTFNKIENLTNGVKLSDHLVDP